MSAELNETEPEALAFIRDHRRNEVHEVIPDAADIARGATS